MSNFEYDKLYDELLSLEKETGIVLANSPTVNVGYEVCLLYTSNAQERGTLFIGPGEKVYSGMVVGQTGRAEDIEVNVCKTKHLSNTRTSSSDEALRLVPKKVLSLEQALELSLIHILGKTIVYAMNQAFFPLSVGIGSMAIFGSYIEKDHSLLSESINIAALDTFVAITSGLIIFPACFTFGVDQTQGPSLIFITLPNICLLYTSRCV